MAVGACRPCRVGQPRLPRCCFPAPGRPISQSMLTWLLIEFDGLHARRPTGSRPGRYCRGSSPSPRRLQSRGQCNGPLWNQRAWRSPERVGQDDMPRHCLAPAAPASRAALVAASNTGCAARWEAQMLVLATASQETAVGRIPCRLAIRATRMPPPDAPLAVEQRKARQNAFSRLSCKVRLSRRPR